MPVRRPLILGLAACLLSGCAAGATKGTGTPSGGSAAAIAFRPPKVLPSGNLGTAVRAGRALFLQSGAIAGNSLSCTSCHVAAGTDAKNLPLVGVSATFPQVLRRSGQVVTMEDRINGCVRRSLDGPPLALGSRELTALDAYMAWLSTGYPVQPGGKLPWVRHAASTATAPPSASNGARLFAQTCAVCHGANGAGGLFPGAPALWGSRSFTSRAGMSKQAQLAQFIRSAMPYREVNGVKPGGLSEEQANDLAAFILDHPRPQPPPA